MRELNNPYDCGSPGNLFTGYELVRRKMVRGLKNGNSYALLGGRRCGKTSFLIQLEADVHQGANETHTLLPRILDMQAIAPRSPADFFQPLYTLAIQDTDAPSVKVKHYQDFLARMDQAKSFLEKKHGPNWMVVLLIDELEAAIERLPDSECLENLRNLLTMSRYKRHFRAVVTGVFSPSELAAKGSPLNNLNPEYLTILGCDEARQLIAAGFPDGLDRSIEDFVLQHTGRHPYILQGLLGYLWDLGEVSETTVRAATRRFVRDRDGTFRSWLQTFRKEGCALYQTLADNKLQGPPDINALTILSYHGVIDESQPEQPQISSTIFREWFRANQKVEKSVGVLEPPPAPARSTGSRVFVVHGRNKRIRVALFTFLRTLGLEPLEWTALVEATNNPAPHINEILKAGFKIANSAVVLFTPDDEARLREEFQQADDPGYETTLHPQPRPNVLFEAGMAMATFPNQTVLLQVGPSRPFTDIAGIHIVRMDNSIERRRDLANRLKTAGCEIADLNSTLDWQTAGDFSLKEASLSAKR